MSLAVLASYVKARSEGKYRNCTLVVAEGVLDVLRREWPAPPPEPWEAGKLGELDGFFVRVDPDAEAGSWALVVEPGVPVAQGTVELHREVKLDRDRAVCAADGLPWPCRAAEDGPP